MASDFVVEGITSTPPWWGNKHEKAKLRITLVVDGAVDRVLFGLQFVLMSVWPSLRGGCSLTLGKERVKE